MEPFRTTNLYDSIDLFLINENSETFDMKKKIPDEKKICFNKKEFGIEKKILAAKILFIHPENFAEWTQYLVDYKNTASIKLFIIAGCDLALSNDNLIEFTQFYPKTEFWVQNWLGDLPFVKSLPIGVFTYFPVSIERSKLFFISFVTLNSPERMKYKDFVYAYPPIQKYMCDFLAGEAFSKKMSSHFFTFCPQGNGYDSYRLWEALACGTVPILLKTPFTDSLLRQHPQLPLIILKNYTDLFGLISILSKELYESIMEKGDVSIISNSYWLTRVN
jgi:hypothetical protein